MTKRGVKRAPVIDVVRAAHTRGFELEITFSDGTRRRVDFAPFLERSQLPDVAKYREEKHFRRFSIVQGQLMWGDYEMLFPVAQLWSGHIAGPADP